MKPSVRKRKYAYSNERIDERVLILKQPIIIYGSGFEMEIEKFDEIDSHDRENDRQVCHEHFPYAVSERGKVVSFKDMKNINYKNKIEKYYLFF